MQFPNGILQFIKEITYLHLDNDLIINGIFLRYWADETAGI